MALRNDNNETVEAFVRDDEPMSDAYDALRP